MELTPRYDGPAILVFDGPLVDVAVPLVRQRRRLGETLGGLDASQWSSSSRCAAWTVRDVVAHLVGTDQFWALAATRALAGTPTRYLVGFDPAATPAQLVAAKGHQSPPEVLAEYQAGVDAFAAVLDGVDESDWSLPAEAPPGHIPLLGLAHHAIWDAWIHERDIVLPLGLPPVEEPDELAACLRYAGALGPMLMASRRSSRHGVLALDGTDPSLRVVIDAGETVVVRDGEFDGDLPVDAIHLSARTVELVEALSQRGPMPCAVAEADRWMVDGIAEVFETTPAA